MTRSGIFAAWDLPVVQPYAVTVDEYLILDDDFPRSENRKQRLSQAIFRDSAPDYVFSRAKVVGNPDTGGGVLTACVDRGFDGAWLRRRVEQVHLGRALLRRRAFSRRWKEWSPIRRGWKE